MLPLLSLPLFASALLHSAHAVLHSSIPEDLHAFPKYRVSFLNGLPVSNHTAEHWLKNGLRGGEAEFLAQWDPESNSHINEIGSGDDDSSAVFTHAEPPRDQAQDNAGPLPALELMHLGPSKSFICLIPPPPTLPPPTSDDAAPVTPSHSWSLLQPLSGTCLYHRQGWFTYSYCHNLHVRQFRELPLQYPHSPGARVIEEDPEWEAYTLGRSSSSRSVGGELTVNDEAALANDLELARQDAGQRYLVQRWTDGTMCDKTGRPREIEVQFHCSMTMTDTVMFVKETRTCEYLLVIHTPRLCGEPGFKSRREQMPEAAVRCREIVDGVEDADVVLSEARHPHPSARPRRQPIPAPQHVADGAAKVPPDQMDRTQDTAKLLRRALEHLLGRKTNGEGMQVFELQPGDEEGEFFINLDVDDFAAAGGNGGEQGEASEPETVPAAQKGTGKTPAEALRPAGYEPKGQQKGKIGDEERKKDKTKKQSVPTERRDEL